jgi:hypothetical protein
MPIAAGTRFRGSVTVKQLLAALPADPIRTS